MEIPLFAFCLPSYDCAYYAHWQSSLSIILPSGLDRRTDFMFDNIYNLMGSSPDMPS